MIKNNKLKTVISTIIILLPMLAAFIVDKIATPVIPGSLVFCKIVPLVLVLMHLFLLVVVSFDKQSRTLNKKITGITFFILPTVSIFMSTFMLAIAYGYEFNMVTVLEIFLSILFIVLGNFLPKATQNRTFGIKTRYTLANEENWNATHRFCAKLWVGCGIVMLPISFLPETISYIAFGVVLAIFISGTSLYPYMYYRKQLASGSVEQSEYLPKKLSKKATIITAILSTVLVAFLVVITFLGKLTFTFEQENLKIDTTFGGGIEIKYSEIDAVEFRENKVDGVRYGGFGSARLLFGVFKNNEFEYYTRYTYTKSENAIVIYSNGDEIVIADIDAESTRALYDEIIERWSKYNESN